MKHENGPHRCRPQCGFIIKVGKEQLFVVTFFPTTKKNSGQQFSLTPSLPRRHLKTNDNNAKFEIFAPSFVLALPSEKISVRKILKVDLFDIGPENTLFADMCVDFSAQKL